MLQQRRGFLSRAWLSALVSTFLLAPTALHAQQWSLGTVADSSTGISLQYKQKYNTAVHVSMHFFADDVFSLEGDWQSFYTPSYDWRPINYKLYTGIGMQGSAEHADPSSETYTLAIPLGVQWNPQSFPLEVFAEASALIGALPATGVKGRARGGLRAVF